MPLSLIRIVITFLVLVYQAVSLEAQQPNPFQLRRTTVLVDSSALRNKNPADVRASNPFFLRPGGDVALPEVDSRWLSWVNTPEHSRIKHSEIQSLIFWSLLFLSFLLAIALNINRSVTIKLYRSLLNLNFLNLLYRDSKEENLLIYYLLYGLYFIGLSLFIYLSILHFKGIRAPVYIFHISVYVMLAYGLRHLSLRLIGNLYGLSREADHYLFSIVIFSCVMAIILIPADFIIAFVNPEIGTRCIWLIFIIFISLYTYRQLREIIFTTSLWRQHILHFLLYLCTFEIAPHALFFVFLVKQGVI